MRLVCQTNQRLSASLQGLFEMVDVRVDSFHDAFEASLVAKQIGKLVLLVTVVTAVLLLFYR